VSDKDLKDLKAQGKIKKYITKAKWFNIIINGIPMLPPDNLMPYIHGFYPISKGVFEMFSPNEFYWGNSMPNKARHDKKFLDGFKTLIRYKAKLAAMPPGLNTSGQHIDSNIFIPGNITDLAAGTDVTKVFQTVQGISQGVTNGDIKILEDTNNDLERDTISNLMAGSMPTGVGTMNVRVMQMLDQQSQQSMAGFAQQIAYLQEARAYPILKASFQFLTRQAIAKLSIPDQSFDDGKTGTFEIIFKKLPKMTNEERLSASFNILDRQLEAKKKGHAKQITEVDIEYILNLDFYCKANAESLAKDTTALREARAQMKWETYSQNPIFNVKKAARKLVRELGDTDDMVNDEPQQPGQPMQPGLPGQPEQPAGNSPVQTGVGPAPIPPSHRPGARIIKPMLARQHANFNPNV
jgi:hypothetical protein